MPKPEQQSLFLRTPDERQAGLDAVRAIKGNLSSMISDRPRFTPAGPADPRFMGTEQRKRMGGESSHLAMISEPDYSPKVEEMRRMSSMGNGRDLGHISPGGR